MVKNQTPRLTGAAFFWPAFSRKAITRKYAPAFFDAVDEVRVGALCLAHDLDHREAPQDFLPQDPKLQLGQPVPDATMDAKPERQMLPRPLAGR